MISLGRWCFVEQDLQTEGRGYVRYSIRRWMPAQELSVLSRNTVWVEQAGLLRDTGFTDMTPSTGRVSDFSGVMRKVKRKGMYRGRTSKKKYPVDGAYAEVKKRNGGSKKTRRALTVEQQRAFMEYVAGSPFFFHWYPFFTFLLGTGCRIGEAIGIRWDDVDMEKRIININHSLTYYSRADDSFKCEFRVSEPKTEAGMRDIPMMEPVYEVLKSEWERQQEEGFCEENVDGMTNFIFTNRFGMPHNPATVNRAIKRIVDAHNSEEEVKAKKQKREPIMIPRFSCHIFRHTFASRFCENEINVKVIQGVMGHADVTTTMNIYAEVNTEVTRESLENLAKNMNVF